MVLRKILLKEVQKVVKYLDSSYALVKVHDGRLWYNNTIFQYSSKGIDGLLADWDFELNGSDLLKILRLYKGNELELTLEGTKLQIHGEFTSDVIVNGCDLHYLNDYDEIIYQHETEMPFDFDDKLRWVAQAMSKDDLRPYMCNLIVSDGVIAATDGRRLNYVNTTGILVGSDLFKASAGFGITHKVIRALISNKQIILSSGWAVDENGISSIRMKMDDGSTLVIQESAAKPPNFERVIPSTNTLEVDEIGVEFYDHLVTTKQALSAQSGWDDRRFVLWFTSDKIHVGYIRKVNTAEPDASESISNQLEEIGSCKANVSRLLDGTEMFLNIDYMLEVIKGTFKKVPQSSGSSLMGTDSKLVAKLRFEINQTRSLRPICIDTYDYRALIMPMGDA